MGNRFQYIIFVFTSFLMLLFLSACGGGGGNGDPETTVQSGAQPVLVEGIAAAGVPLSGTAELSDSSNPTRTKSAVINQDGAFSMDVSGMKAPFILRATDASGNHLYSFAKGGGIANINPLTNLAVAVAAGINGMEELDGLYVDHNMASMLNIANTIDQAKTVIASSLHDLLALFGAETTDPLTGVYLVNRQGLDGLFEQVTFTISDAMVSLTRSDGATFFTAPLADISSSTVPTTGISPTLHNLPGNAVLTLALQGTLDQGTLVKNLSLSLAFPLGIGIDPDPADSSGLTAAVNTAVPVAAGANVYPAPALTATNSTLNIKMSSLAGFSTGNFLTVRLIIPTAPLMSATTTADFTITSSRMYADIYRNKLIKGLSIVPVSLVYPGREGKTIYNSLCARCHTLDPSDSVITISLYRKTSLLADEFKTAHHGTWLSSTQLEYLQEFMAAYFSGQQIF